MNKFVVLMCLLVMGLFIGDVFALNAPSMQGVNQPDNWYTEVQFQANTGARATYDLNAEHGTVLEWTVNGDDDHVAGYTVHRADASNSEIVAGIIPTRSNPAFNRDREGLVVDETIFMMQISGLAEDLPDTNDSSSGAGKGAVSVTSSFGPHRVVHGPLVSLQRSRLSVLMQPLQWLQTFLVHPA